MVIHSLNGLIAQTVYQLPPNQPEQDACNALQLCGNTFYTPYSYTGSGLKLDLDSTPCSPKPGGGERNSVWLEVHTIVGGNIVFKIKPVDATDDYDFAVLDITGKDCNSLNSGDVVRCNYNNNILGSNVNGIIGLSDTSFTPYIQKGTFGGSFCEPVFAKSGGDYLIMINNNGNYVSGGPSKGFTIDFTGSTAIFGNTMSPLLNSADVPCTNSNSIIVKTNNNVLCNSIAADGSDFTTNAPAKIISAYGLNCNDRGGYTNSIVINFSTILPSGSYTISAKKGSDNNTLRDFCGNDLVLPSSVPFIINKNGKVAIDNEFICYQQLPFLWHGLKINGNDSGKIYVSKSAEGCDSTTVLNLHVSSAPHYTSITQSVCDGDTYILPWDSAVSTAGIYTHHYTNSNGCDTLVENVNVTIFTPPNGNVQARDSTIETGFCENGSILLDPGNKFVSYLWNTGQTTSTILVNVAGAYSLIAKDNYQCTTIDTFAVAAYAYPTPVFGKVENLCTDSTVTLDAGSGSSLYFWNDGSRNQTLTTDKPGKFWVLITSVNNCIASDTVTVVKVAKPANFLINDVTKCSFKDVILSPLSNFKAYEWSNGYTTKNIDVSVNGLYWLKVTDTNGCTGRDSVTVIDSTCPQYFYMPNAFTPNNDGLNDFFKPLFEGTLSGFHFSIYNRWGRLIFSTSNTLKGWDGNVNGFQQPIGAYIWICTYSLNGQPLRTEKGTVTLIR